MKVKLNRVKILLQITNVLEVRDVDAVVRVAPPDLRVTDEWSDLLGEEVLKRLSSVGWCDVGSAVITEAGNLPYKAVIHAVGPRWGEDSARGKLANVTWELLWLAEEAGFRSVAVPPISVGSLGYPIENCARTMLQQTIDFTFEPIRYLRTVLFCLSSETEYEVFCSELLHQMDAIDPTSTSA